MLQTPGFQNATLCIRVQLTEKGVQDDPKAHVLQRIADTKTKLTISRRRGFVL